MSISEDTSGKVSGISSKTANPESGAIRDRAVMNIKKTNMLTSIRDLRFKIESPLQ
jgi:hypothetical protein